MYGEFGGGGGGTRPSLPRERAPFSAKTPWSLFFFALNCYSTQLTATKRYESLLSAITWRWHSNPTAKNDRIDFIKGLHLKKLEKAVAVRNSFPKGPKIEKIQDLENFKRDWRFQARRPPDPYFCGEFWRSGLKFSSEIEIFKRDWKFQSRLNFFNLWALREFTINSNSDAIFPGKTDSESVS